MTLDTTTPDLAAALRSVQRRIAETEMRTSARTAGIEKLYQAGESSSDAEADLYDDLDTLLLLRVQQWTLQSMLEHAGGPTEEDLSIIDAKIFEIEQVRSTIDEPSEGLTGVEPFRTVVHLLHELDDTLAILQKSRSRSGSAR